MAASDGEHQPVAGVGAGVPDDAGARAAQDLGGRHAAQDLAAAPEERTESAPEWADLPEIVRTAVIGIAAHALGSAPADQVPAALRSVARFTPGKRASRGSVPLARALEHDAGFRALVAQQLPAESDARGDAVGVAARAFLLRLPGRDDALADAARVDEVAALRSQVAELIAAVDKLTGRLARAAVPSRDGGPPPTTTADNAEVTRLRQRLREQGARARQAELDAQAALADAEQRLADAQAHAARQQASADNWRSRAEQEAHRADLARQALDRLREESGRERADADRRIDLLLDTVQRAAAGLRHEWRLATGGSDPADVVARGMPDVEPARRRAVDPALLLDWLGLPGAHLIVDGYNVTKTGYPDLSLADQRDRLVRSSAALAARTGAEITVVFDGAAVVAAAPSVRGVRVMFSPPGVIADDVVRRLAAAEPAGRVTVVVSSDREVVDGVRRSGARTAPSAVLLAVL